MQVLRLQRPLPASHRARRSHEDKGVGPAPGRPPRRAGGEMKPLIDAGARERIETDLDVSMCVEAGAGTGKTTMLVKRIVALLRSGRATIDQLAVITFTEKAAAELSAGIRFELEVAVEGTSDEDE